MKAWEDLCRRCGQCCFEKWVEGDGKIRYTRIPCRHLDMISRECRVYEKRLEMREGCVRLTPENVLEFHWLPADCAYVELLAGGPGIKGGRTQRSKSRRGPGRR